ncbi:MAG: asparagine synthase (glutamine-hydrolyzing), partial [Roseomonas sp.]|nr:asparagine synthase (glutamine-hydrolyzing) [Roseomonas sp.]
MHSPDGRFVLVFNGEIYNHRELRRELEAAGDRFRGHSDTEVLLAACLRWGVAAAAARCNGMFAFALWDREARQLSLARDPVGIKPLYWTVMGGTLIFGSELKALRAHPGFVAALDPAAAAGYLRFAYVPGSASIYAGVRKLPPGTVLRFGPSVTPEAESFWSMEDAIAPTTPGAPLPDEEAVRRLEALLGEAVARQLVADVPVGVFLSGGIDSSVVTALAQAGRARPVRSFSIGFHDDEHDEARHAAAVARHLGTDHTELYVDAAMAQEVLPRLPDMYDEPFGDSSQIPTHLVCALTRQHMKVVLSGDGGDELFGGYSRYMHALRLTRLPARLPPPLRRLGAAALRRMPGRGLDRLGGALGLRRLGTRLNRAGAMLAAGGEDALYLALMSHWGGAESPLPGVAEHPGPFSDAGLPGRVPEFLRRMQLLDAQTYLPDDILVKVDRASMAVGLEARVPLLDVELVRFAGRLTAAQRLRGATGKWVLRQVLYRHVPQPLVDRPKMGFGVPVGEWMRGPLRDWCEDLLAARSLEASGLDPRLIRERWAQHASRAADWRYQLWTVLMFVAWQRRWLA